MTAPDGTPWRVGRQWTSRPPRLRWRKPKGGSHLFDGLDLLAGADDLLAGIGAAIASAIFLAVVIFVIWPILALGVELLLVFLILSSGIFGRVFLRRPWTVRATPAGTGKAAQEWKIAGWFNSRRLIREITSALTIGTALPPHIG